MELGDLLFTNEAGGDGQKDKPSPLVGLQKDLDFYSDAIQEVASDIIQEGLSDYPIFIAHQHEVSVGEVILDRNDLGTSWTIQVSTMEEFVEKGLIKAERKDRFVKHYKSPEDHMCLFVIVPQGANFVFYPYKKQDE